MRREREECLARATEVRLTTRWVRPETQVHAHLCCAAFGDVVQAIGDLVLDADVISLEAARSHPRVAREPAGQTGNRATLRVDPDCGAKTRARPETRASLENLVAAARTVRTEPAGSWPGGGHETMFRTARRTGATK
jgi:5-methyltetrahydropteroyltriglutamate--homocysteine methyltransferase